MANFPSRTFLGQIYAAEIISMRRVRSLVKSGGAGHKAGRIGVFREPTPLDERKQPGNPRGASKTGSHSPNHINSITEILWSRLLAADAGQLVIVYQLRMMGFGFIPAATFSKYKRVEGIDYPNVNTSSEMIAKRGN
jgi:hypothetical protein